MRTRQQPPLGTRATVQTITVDGATYECRLVCCNKPNCGPCNADGRRQPSHGPYWYLCYTSRRRTCRAYLGKKLDTLRFRDETGRINLDLLRSRGRIRNHVDTPNPGPPAQQHTLEQPAKPARRSLVRAVTNGAKSLLGFPGGSPDHGTP